MNDQSATSAKEKHFISPKVSVVIPTFNRGRDLLIVLQALLNQVLMPAELIVVDNSSTDDTSERLEAFSKMAPFAVKHIVKEPEGPAAARQVGIEQAKHNIILFLDSDVELCSTWLSEAVAYLNSDSKIGAVGGQIIYQFDRQKVNAFGGDLGIFGLAWDLCEGADLRQDNEIEKRIWVNCSAMLVQKAAVEQILGFDSRFFYGYEDSDIGWKLNLAGYETHVVGKLKAFHHVEPITSDTHPTIVFHYCKNRLASLIQCCSLVSLLWRLPLYLAYVTLDLSRGHVSAKLKAISWNISELPETIKRRRIIQRSRLIADRTLFAIGAQRWFPPTPLAGKRRREVAGDYARTTTPLTDDRV